MKEYLVLTFRRERDSILYLVSHQRKAEVLILLVIFLVLVLSALLSLFDLLSDLSLVHHNRAMLLEVNQSDLKP